MKLNILILLVTILTGFGVTYLMQGSLKSVTKSPTMNASDLIGKNLPEFTMETLEGGTLNSRDFEGKTILVNFWATWCPPCIVEFPQLLELARKHSDKLVLLAISSDQNIEAIERFIGKLEKTERATLEQENVLIIKDQDNSITFELFNTVMLPETLIVGPEQKILHKLVGVNWEIEDVEKFLPANQDIN